MKRSYTNKIRFFMDEFIPPIIRDSRWFMRLFYMLAYRKRNVAEIMDFKSRVWNMSTEEYDSFYSSLNSISRNRLTDLNDECLDCIREISSVNISNVLDVGCGRGYLLEYLRKNTKLQNLFGTDLFENHSSSAFTYKKSHADSLPFEDNSIDLVTCCHVLEHVKDPKTSRVISAFFCLHF
jgi:2-polyprenyl-3-methyl-5-hydroxy-6-metoxy-1,4-benzoquinol methylase